MESQQPLLTSVEVVCREVPGFTAQQQVVRCIEAFLDYAPQFWCFGLHVACQRLPLRLVKREFASREWDQEKVVDGVKGALYAGKLDVLEWLCSAMGEMTNTPITEILRKAEALKEAAYGGHLPAVQWLVENSVVIEQGDIVLSYAARGNHFSVVKWLLEHGANPHEVDYYERTALHYFAAKGNFEMVRYMMDNGADVELRGRNAGTALNFAAEASEENIDLVRFLLDRGIQATDTDTWGRTALYYASVAQNFEVAEYLLNEFFTDNEPPPAELQRALFNAAGRNCVKLVLYLIKRGVDTHCKTFQGQTALHEAAASGAIEPINVLLEQGLHVHEADKFGVTPLLEASRHGQVDAIRRLFEAGGSLDEFDLAGQTTLHLAAKGGHKKSVDLLVEDGADISCYDKRGWTPLHHAASGGHVDVVKAFVALDVSLECKTNAGDTAEVLAVLGGHSDVAKMLGVNETVDLGFEKYKEYLLDREGVHFNSIASTRIGIATGLWLEAPIEIMLKGQNSTSQSFVDLLNRWSRLNHPHILKLYGFCHADTILSASVLLTNIWEILLTLEAQS